MSDIYVVGVGMTPFGRMLDIDMKTLSRSAVDAALGDAGLQKSDIEAAFFANASQGHMERQHMIRGEILLREMGIGGVPVVNVENACASGSTAFNLAVTFLKAGEGDVALALGAEKMFSTDRKLMFEAFDSAWDVSRDGEIRDRLLALGEGVDQPALEVVRAGRLGSGLPDRLGGDARRLGVNLRAVDVGALRDGHAPPRHGAVGVEPRRFGERGLPLGQVRLAQQPPRARREARVEKVLAQARPRATEHRGEQAVAAFHVTFGAQVLEVHPGRRGGAVHPLDEGGRWVAAEGFDHDVAWLRYGLVLLGRGPCVHGHAGVPAAICRAHLGGHPGERCGIVHPQSHLLAARSEVARQAPAHADVTKVVDHATEDVPEHGRDYRQRLRACPWLTIRP